MVSDLMLQSWFVEEKTDDDWKDDFRFEPRMGFLKEKPVNVKELKRVLPSASAMRQNS